MTPVVGIDPGGTNTGIVVREGDRLWFASTLHRALRPLPEYIADVLRVVDEAQHRPGLPIAVEDVTPPTGFRNGQRAPIDPASLIGTAAVLGAVLARYPDAVVVPPGGHGSGPAGAYPPELIGPREGKALTGRLRHCRSAWDVAGAARLVARIGAAS